MKTVILLHSSLASSRQWRRLIQDYGNQFRFVAVDLLGYGEAPFPASPDTFRLADEVQHLAQALVDFPEPFHLVGHSYGGAVALQFACTFPARVKSVFAYEPVLFALLQPSEREDIDSIRGTGVKAFFDYWSGPGAWDKLSPERKKEYEYKAPKVDLDFQALLHDPTTLEQYGHLPMPVTIMAGELSQPPARRLAQLLETVLPPGSVRILPGIGHLAPLTHPERINAQVISTLLPKVAHTSVRAT